MFLRFPNLETLQLALTSGAAPKTLSLSPALAGFAGDGAVWLKTSRNPSGTCQKKLADLGVSTADRAEIECDVQLDCWHQAAPLVPVRDGGASSEKDVVLFELPIAEQLPELINEILRLGNDRQSFRTFLVDGAPRALLRVIGPPYYSLLRALEQRDLPGSPRAYREQASRVWVEVGFEHPFADRLKPAAGAILFLRAPREWITVEEGKFQDIYDTLEFQLPAQPSTWQAAELEQRLEAPLRLTNSGSLDAAELWVLEERGEQQLDELVRNSDNHLLARLSFAVGVQNGSRKIVVRARPSKEPPPVLVLDGVACRPYLKLPNLFLPCDRRLHPPLRRDAVIRLLASDKESITWLTPMEGGSFVPESLPDAAFRPLQQWVDYILEHHHQPLEAWLGANQFQFESFICRDPQGSSPASPKKSKPPKSGRLVEDDEPELETAFELEEIDSDTGDEEFHAPAIEPLPPDLSQQRLRELEDAFLALDEPLEGPQRTELWLELGAENIGLGNSHEGTICWSNGFWEGGDFDLARRWLESLAPGASRHGLAEEDFDRITADQVTAAPLLAAKLTAYLVWCSYLDTIPAEAAERLPQFSQFLRNQESYLPVRAAWLAWSALAKISHDDVLSLARARDRLLERLYHLGLRPETDMPSFLHLSAVGDPERFRQVREEAFRLRTLVAQWIKEPGGPEARTAAYVELIFAYGFARLGDAVACQEGMKAAAAAFTGNDPVHKWLQAAYELRVRQVLDGSRGDDQLPEELLEPLKQMKRLTAYAIDRLRQNSRILEPNEVVNPFQRWHGRFVDDLARELAELYETNDRDQIQTKLRALLRKHESRAVSTSQLRIVIAALELAPRLGGRFAGEVLDATPRILATALPIEEKASLLEKGLFLAAHFDQVEHVRSFVTQFVRTIPQMVEVFREGAQSDQVNASTLESLLTTSFRSLRKLGMRDEIAQLLALIAEHARQPAVEKKTEKPALEYQDMQSLKLLLSVAGGWFYFGQNQQAEELLQEVRQSLFEEPWRPSFKAQLACSYVAAASMAPLTIGLPELKRLFSFQREKRVLSDLDDQLFTSIHFSLRQLQIVEALVLALVSDNFVLNAESRRWLDEDEFLVRRRIHSDVRRSLAAADQ